MIHDIAWLWYEYNSLIVQEMPTIKVNTSTKSTQRGKKPRQNRTKVTNALSVVMCEPLKVDKRALK